MSNLESLSHAINAEHANSMKEEGSKGSLKGSPKPVKLSSPTFDLPPPPPPAPAKKEKESAKEIERIQKEQERKGQEKRKAELIRKVTQYAENERLGSHFPEALKERASKVSYKDSLESVEGIYEEFMSCLKQNHKRLFVNMMFDQFCNVSEQALVQLAQMPQKRGVGAFLAMNKETIMQPELDEMLIEMSDSYLPGPWTRAAMKMVQVMMMYDVSTIGAMQAAMAAQQKSNNEENEKEEDKREGSLFPDGIASSSSSSSSSHAPAKRFPSKVSGRRGK